MSPLRAFIFSLAAGLIALFSCQELLSMTVPAPDARIGAGPLHIPTA